MGSSARPGLAGSSFNGPSGFAGPRPWLSHQGSPSRVREQAAAGRGFGSTRGVARPPRPCSPVAVGQGHVQRSRSSCRQGGSKCVLRSLMGQDLEEGDHNARQSLSPAPVLHASREPMRQPPTPPQGPLPPRAGPQAPAGGEGSARGPGEGVHRRVEGALSCQHPKNGDSQTITVITGLPVSLYGPGTSRMPPQTLGGGLGLGVLPGPRRDGHSLGGLRGCSHFKILEVRMFQAQLPRSRGGA